MLLLILITLFFELPALAAVYLISPSPGCFSGCQGTSVEPYDSLLQALSEHGTENAEFLLLNPGTYIGHYLLLSEIISPTTRVYPQTVSLTGNIEIMPLYCGSITTDPSLCIEIGKLVPIYIKSDNISIIVGNQLTVRGLAFLGSENIESINPYSPMILSACVFNRTLCCYGAGTYSLLDPAIRCQAENLVATNPQTTQGFFQISQTVPTNFTINGCILGYMYSLNTESFIKINSAGQLNLENLEIQDSFFSYGLISYSQIALFAGITQINTAQIISYNSRNYGPQTQPILFSCTTIKNSIFILNNTEISNMTTKAQVIEINDGTKVLLEALVIQNLTNSRPIFQIQNTTSLILVAAQMSLCNFEAPVLAASSMIQVEMQTVGIAFCKINLEGDLFQVTGANDVIIQNNIISSGNIFYFYNPNGEAGGLNSELVENKFIASVFNALYGPRFIRGDNGKVGLSSWKIKNNEFINGEFAYVSNNALQIGVMTFSNNQIQSNSLFLLMGYSVFSNLEFEFNEISSGSIVMGGNPTVFAVESSSFTGNIIGDGSSIAKITGGIGVFQSSIISNHIVTGFTASTTLFNLEFLYNVTVANITINNNTIDSLSSLRFNAEILYLNSLLVESIGIYVTANTILNGEGSCVITCSTICNMSEVFLLYNQIEGYGIQINKAQLSMQNIIVSGNSIQAPINTFNEISALIFSYVQQNWTINNISVFDNSINNNGAAIYYYIVQGGMLSNGTFYNNTLNFESCLFYNSVSYANTTQSYIHSNFLSGTSSFIFSDEDDATLFYRCVFENNEYLEYATLVYIFPSGQTELRYCTFLDYKIVNSVFNNLTGQDTLINNHEATLYIMDSTFENPLLISTIIGDLKMSNCFINIKEVNPITNFFLIYTSTFWLTNITFNGIGKTNVTQLMKVIASSPILKEVTIINIESNSGYLFDFSGGQLQAENIEISNSYFTNNGYLILYNSGSSLIFKGLSVHGLSSQIVFSNSENLTISSSYFNLVAVSDYFINFENLESLNMQNNTFIVASTTGTIPYFIQFLNPSGTIIMDQLRVQNTETASGGLFINFEKQGTMPSISIQNSQFMNNTVKGGNGAAISTSLSNCTLDLLNISFIGNKAVSQNFAGGSGGAIYLYTQQNQEDTSTITINSCTFQNNEADVYGGAIYVLGIQPLPLDLSSTNIFLGNQAGSPLQNNSFGSYAASLVLNYVNSTGSFLSSVNGSGPFMNNAASGQNIENPFNIIVTDIYNQEVFSDSSSLITLITSESSLLPSFKQMRAVKGVYYLYELVLIDVPGTSGSITFVTDGIQNFENVPYNSAFNQNITMDFYFRNCIEGEIIAPNFACQVCGYGTFLVNLENNSYGPCENCELNAQACPGGADTYALNGYWRMNLTSNLILPCPISAACQTSVSNNEYTNQCEYGYQGPLCDSCIDGWGKDSTGVCFKCSQLSGHLWGVIAGAIASMGMIFYTIYVEVKAGAEYLTKKEEADRDASQGILLRSLFNYFQMITLISNLKAKWPNYFGSLIQVSNWMAVTKIDVANIDCFFTKHQAIGINATYAKIILSNVGPMFMCAGAVILWFFWYLIKKKPFDRSFGDRVIVSIMIICFSMQPGAIGADLGLFECDNLYRSDKVIEYLSMDYNIECWTPEHSTWTFGFAVPMILFWALVLPAPVFIIMRLRKDRLYTQEMTQRFSFLYRGYKSQIYFWEMLVFLRKYILLLIGSMETFIDAEVQLYLALYVIIIALALHKKYHPYQENLLNNLESLSLFCAGVINSGALYYRAVQSSQALSYLMLGSAVAANFVFLLVWVKEYIYFKFKKGKKIPDLKQWRRARTGAIDKLAKDFDDEEDVEENSRDKVKNLSEENPNKSQVTEISFALENTTTEPVKKIFRSKTFNINLNTKEDNSFDISQDL